MGTTSIATAAYSVTEVAQALRLSSRAVRGYIRDGKLEAVNIGNGAGAAGVPDSRRRARRFLGRPEGDVVKVATAPAGARWYDALELGAHFEARAVLGRKADKRPELVPYLAGLLIRRRRELAAERARGESHWPLEDAA